MCQTLCYMLRNKKRKKERKRMLNLGSSSSRRLGEILKIIIKKQFFIYFYSACYLKIILYQAFIHSKFLAILQKEKIQPMNRGIFFKAECHIQFRNIKKNHKNSVYKSNKEKLCNPLFMYIFSVKVNFEL